MTISQTAWSKYIKSLAAINKKAADLMQTYINEHGFGDSDALLRYAFAISSRYGKAAGALTCRMYDAIATAQGASVPAAEMADLATMNEVASAVYGAKSFSETVVPAAVAKLVKLVSADTMLQNAARDGAEFAWIPSGDTCAFCITLASRGWQRQSRKAAKSHASHIHANCNCEYAVRFNSNSNVKGYDPDKYYEQYSSHDGSPNEKIKAMRRDIYAENKDEINAQKRAAYARRMEIKRAQEQS